MTPTTSNGNPLIQQAGQIVYRKRKYQNSAASDNDFSDDESSPKTGSPSVDDDKRAHHNELERKRRDHIKDHFMNLKSSIPLLEGEKSSRALILKRAVDYIAMLQNQVKELKERISSNTDDRRSIVTATSSSLEFDDVSDFLSRPLQFEFKLGSLKRRNENVTQQTSGLNLKPFLTSLQLQSATTQPSLFVPMAQQQPQMIQQSNIPIMSTSTTHSTSPNTSTFDTSVNFSGSLTNGLPNHNGSGFCHTSNSPQCTSTITTPIPALQNPSLIANLSNLLLQNPSLLSQLQNNSQLNLPAFEPLTPPSSASLTNQQNGLINQELIDAQTRLLASSLALKERQFAAVVATNL